MKSRKEYMKLYYAANKDRIKSRISKQGMAEHIRLYQKDYHTKNSESLKEKRYRRLPFTLHASAKASARARGIFFGITPADIHVPDKCPVLGFDFTCGSPKEMSPSLDRKDNKIGYTPDNIRVISWRANRIKSDATTAEIRAILKYVED